MIETIETIETDPAAPAPRAWKRAKLVAGSIVLVAMGVLAGLALRSSDLSPSAARTAGANKPTPGAVVNLTQATARACAPPVPPGPGHPDPVLSQLFSVRSGSNAAYLLGWQIVPYRGAGTYTLGKDGNLLALQPPAGGQTLGFGTGTITVAGTPQTGSVSAVIKLSAGGTLRVTGNWTCS